MFVPSLFVLFRRSFVGYVCSLCFANGLIHSFVSYFNRLKYVHVHQPSNDEEAHVCRSDVAILYAVTSILPAKHNRKFTLATVPWCYVLSNSMSFSQRSEQEWEQQNWKESVEETQFYQSGNKIQVIDCTIIVFFCHSAANIEIIKTN